LAKQKVPAHQFGLFGFSETKPKLKVPISAARIKEVKAMLEKGRSADALEILRDVRYKLENFEKRLTNRRNE
jgi:hypothetical protein